ncbi:MAG: SanA protein [Maribacter sp.]|jgi:SanA protein
MIKILSFKILLKILGLFTALGFLIIIFIILSNVWIVRFSASQIYTDVNAIPKNDVGLLLGTSNRLQNGRENLYFRYRINATYELYSKGKIKHIIVSGDNHVHSYNEPEDMQLALMELGIPEEKITLDFAGFRTLDSIVRCKKVFQQEKFTIISQNFHNQRAIFIANKYDIDAIAFDARDVGEAYGRKTMLREYFAKVKAVIDLYLLRKQPKFLGEPIRINI